MKKWKFSWKPIVLGITAIFIVGIQQFPNYYAYINTPPGYFFSGQASWFDPWDINVYVTAIRFGQDKHFFLKNHYTIGSQPETLMYPLYTVSGYLFRGSPFLIFHVLATLTGFLICGVLFYFFYKQLKTFWLSLSALIICCLGGGLGWIPEHTFDSAGSNITSFNFASAFQRAHEGIGTLLYIIALYLTYCFVENRKRIIYNYAAISALLLLIFFYPYYLVSYALIVSAYIGFRIRKNKNYTEGLFLIKNCIIVGLVTLLYYLHLRTTDFLTAISEDLNAIIPLSMLLGYSNFLVFFAFSYFIPHKNNKNNTSLFLVIWITISIILSYLPFLGFARFYVRGLFFPLTLLIFLQIQNYKEKFFLPLLIPLMVLLFSLSRVNIFVQRLQTTQGSNHWYYLPNDVLAGFNYLAQQPEDGILTYYVLGNYIPAFTNKSVYLGHLLQTPDVKNRLNVANDFYIRKMDEQTAYKFLKESGIHFVIYTNIDRSLNYPVYSFLSDAFIGSNIQIYRVPD